MSTTSPVLAYCAEMNCDWFGECPATAVCPKCSSNQVRRAQQSEANGGDAHELFGMRIEERAPATSTRLAARVRLTIVGELLRFEWSARSQAPDQSSTRYLRGGVARTFAQAKAAVVETFNEVVGAHALVWREIDEHNEVIAKGCTTQ